MDDEWDVPRWKALHPDDVQHSWCGVCGHVIRSGVGWKMTADRDGRMWAIHEDSRICYKNVQEDEKDADQS